MKIRTGDTVLVIAGRDKGKTGRVDRSMPSQNRVVVDGVNIITKHMRARPGIRQSGRIQMEAPLHVSNVVLICNKCNQPTKPRITFLGKRGEGAVLHQVWGSNRRCSMMQRNREPKNRLRKKEAGAGLADGSAMVRPQWPMPKIRAPLRLG